MKKYLLLVLILIIIIVLINLDFFSTLFMVAIKQTQLSSEEWLEDIKYLRREITVRHKDAYANISDNELDKMFNDLTNDVPDSDGDEVQLRMLDIIADIGDSHTAIRNFITGADLCYPIELYWFDNGYYVINTIKKYQYLIGSELNKINGISIETILPKLATLIPHENIYMVRNKAPELIRDPRVLRYLGIIEDNDMTFSFLNQENKYLEVAMSPEKINSLELVEDTNGRYSLIKQTYSNWFQYINNQDIIYFYFCKSKIIDSIVNDVIKEVEAGNVDKLIIDLRNNVGGTYIPNNKLINGIKSNEKINKQGNLFVIVGRNTFSAGLLYAVDFRKNTSAIFFGEPTGAKPNHFGDMRKFKLPNSKLVISYSTKYFNLDNQELDSFYPDVIKTLSINDYLNNIDTILNDILNY